MAWRTCHSHAGSTMKPKPTALPSVPFLVLTPVITVLVCAPPLGLWFPGWPAACLEGLGFLALVGALGSQAEQP